MNLIDMPPQSWDRGLIWRERKQYIPSQQQPGYLLSFHVPPTWLPFSTMTKSLYLFFRIKSIAVHSPGFLSILSLNSHRSGLTRYACSDYENGCICMTFSIGHLVLVCKPNNNGSVSGQVCNSKGFSDSCLGWTEVSNSFPENAQRFT